MVKAQRGYRCTACGRESPVQVGRCPGCDEWNTLEAFSRTTVAVVSGRTTGLPSGGFLPADTISLADVVEDVGERYATGIGEFDRVLGGGLVPGSLVLVGGEPGIGKSTLMLQAADRLATSGATVAYLCGEESPRQVKLRASRLGVASSNIRLIPATELGAGLAAAEACAATLLVIDSIQSVSVEGVDTRSGGPAQSPEAGARLVTFAKSTGIAVVITGHVTKGGDIAGPRLLEHLVDAVLYFESADSGALRILRAVKNRFGATDEVGVFEMTGSGLQSVENASSTFLDSGDQAASGCAVTAVIEGTRPIAIEVQALAVPSYLPTPRRIAAGLEQARLHLLLAVLARRAGVNTGNVDIVATVSGGLRLRDPGTDLAVLAALASAVKDVPVAPGTAYLGEAALSGVLRPAQQTPRRLAELARLGFSRCVVPAGTTTTERITLIPAATVRDALGI